MNPHIIKVIAKADKERIKREDYINWISGQYTFSAIVTAIDNVLKGKAEYIEKPILSDMDNYASYWNVDHFNAIEHNLLSIANKVSTKDYGPYQTFYANGIFIGYQELNRIEKTCAELKTMIEDQANMVRRIPFKLGRYKEERF